MLVDVWLIIQQAFDGAVCTCITSLGMSSGLICECLSRLSYVPPSTQTKFLSGLSSRLG